MTNVNDDLRLSAELITGDSDDPPLSEEAVTEMLRMTHLPKRSSLSSRRWGGNR